MKTLITPLILLGILMLLASCEGREELAVDAIDTPFYDLDSDGDGKISRQEADDESIMAYFNHIDTDNSAFLSPEEYDDFIRQNPSLVDQGQGVKQSGSM